MAVSLPDLVTQAAAFKNSPKQERKLHDLVDIWKDRKYLSQNVVVELHKALSGNSLPAGDENPKVSVTNNALKLAKDVPYILPSQLGDSTTPWFDLPASTWLPHLTPNSTKPMLPDQIQPIQLAGGPADKKLAQAVQDLLSDVDRIFSKGRTHGSSDISRQVDINELGERIVLDEITGEVIGGQTYYGWSLPFCEKMRTHRQSGNLAKSRGRSISGPDQSPFRERSRSSSAPGFKRRRRSSSSSSRSDRHRGFSRPDVRRPDDSPGREYRRSPRRLRSRSRSRSRGRAAREFPVHDSQFSQQHQPSQFAWQSTPPNTTLPSLPPGSFPPPPPRPAGYQGPWPPPPPPPLPHMVGAIPPWDSDSGHVPPSMAGWNPYSAGSHQTSHSQPGAGRGFGGHGGHGSADHGRGRGRY